MTNSEFEMWQAGTGTECHVDEVLTHLARGWGRQIFRMILQRALRTLAIPALSTLARACDLQ